MSRLRSFATLFSFLVFAFAIPLVDDDDDDDDDDGCGDTQPPVRHLVASSPPVVVLPDSPPASILAPYQQPPSPRPSHFQHPHATLPVSHRSHIPTMIGIVSAIMVALVAFAVTARYVAFRRRITANPFKDPRKPRFWSRRSTASKKRLSDESWVSPSIPSLISPGSPLSRNPELSRYAYTKHKLVPVTTPVGSPIEFEFGRRLELSSTDPCSAIPVPPVRVPSPVYIPPFSPSPSLSSTSSSISPTPSTEPLSSPSPNPARLSRLLSSTFRDSRSITSPARPTTAYLIQTARLYAHAYRPSSATTTSLYAPPTPSARLGGTRSRTSFYPSSATDDVGAVWARVRDTYSTVTTSETDTIQHLQATSDPEAVSPFADPGERSVVTASGETPVGTSLGLKVRSSDASEHAHYRLREKERERQRQQDKNFRRRSRSLEEVRAEFKLRDSESVLRETGW